MSVRVRDEQSQQVTGRFGRLAPAVGGGQTVRCACDRCGAHLMATRTGADGHRGICLVCGGESVSPV